MARSSGASRPGTAPSSPVPCTTSGGMCRGVRREGATGSVSPQSTRRRTAAASRVRRSSFASLAVLLSLAATAAARPAATALPPLPAKWPHTLQLGMSESPGEQVSPLGFRYQYLAGGVNTGGGWATWNPNGTFASMYVQDSWSHGVTPVLTYYMLLQSKPAGGDELHADLANLRNASTMAAYWRDVTLLFQTRARREAGGRPRRARRVGLRRAGEGGCAGLGVRQAVARAARPARAERDPRVPHERLGHEARHRL